MSFRDLIVWAAVLGAGAFLFDRFGGSIASFAPSRVASSSESANFACEGKVYCSEMASCAEALFYLGHCPGVKIDGDGDGNPCERQWCGRF